MMPLDGAGHGDGHDSNIATNETTENIFTV